jgi:hypothetical protein
VAQVREGITGWICAVLPLIIVNALGYVGLLNTEEALIAGAVALVGGPLVGGAVAGLLGGRPQPGHPGGATGALPAGAIAGSLYLISLLGLVEVATEVGVAPPLLAQHPLRVGLAALCLSCILAAVTLGAGALAARRASLGASQPGVAVPQAQSPGPVPARTGHQPSAATAARPTAAGPAVRSTARHTVTSRHPDAAGSRPSPYRETRR